MSSFSDNFDNGTNGDNAALRPGLGEHVGIYRTIVAGGGQVGADKLGAGSGPGGFYFDCGANDHAAEADLAQLISNKTALVVRFVDNTHWVGVMQIGTGGAGFRLVKRVGATRIDLDTMQGVAGDRYRLEVVTNGSSSDYSVYVNGSATPAMSATVPHSEISGTCQLAGIVNETDNGGNLVGYWDNFFAEDLGAGGLVVEAAGIASAEAIGAAGLTPGAVAITPVGIASAQAIGAATITTGDLTISPAAINSGETLGSPALVAGPVTIAAVAIASAELLGSPALLAAAAGINPTGIASAETPGNPVVQAGSIVLDVTGLASSEALGSPTVAPGPLVLLPESIGSAELVGGALIFNDVSIITPTGITSAEQLGPVTIVGGAAVIGWLAAQLRTGPALTAAADLAPALTGKTVINRVH